RLYYSTSVDGTYTEVTPNAAAGFAYKYAAGKVFAYQKATALEIDFSELAKDKNNNCYGSGFYQIRFVVANLTGRNTDGAVNKDYYFKVDYDLSANASEMQAVLGNSNVASADFTPYLVDGKGIGEYWVGTKDMLGSAYPYIKLQILLANETRKTDKFNAVGINLSGNSLRYTNALGEESAVVVKGGAISSVDSVGGTVGDYDLSRFGLGSNEKAFFDGSFYVVYKTTDNGGVFEIYYGGTSDSAMVLNTTFTISRGEYEKELTKSNYNIGESSFTLCKFRMDFSSIGQIELSDEQGYIANGTNLTNATGSSRKWYTENWKPQIKSTIDIEGEEYAAKSYTYFGIKRNALVDGFGADTLKTWLSGAINGLDESNKYLNYITKDDYLNYLTTNSFFDAILLGTVGQTADSIIPYAASTMADFSMGKQNVAGLFTIYAWTVDQAGNIGQSSVAQIFIDGNRYTIASYLDKETANEFISADCLSVDDIAIEMKDKDGNVTTEFRRGDTVTFGIKWVNGFFPYVIATAEYKGGSLQYDETTKNELYKAEGDKALTAKYFASEGLNAKGINVGETVLLNGVYNCEFTWSVDNAGTIFDNHDFFFNAEEGKTIPTAYVFSFRRLASLTRASASVYYNGESQDMPYTGAITDENYERWADGYTFANNDTQFGVNLKYYAYVSDDTDYEAAGYTSLDSIKNAGQYFVYAQVNDNCYIS
ncbi:MAG: hypothetical protein MRZ86_05060, partial [Acidaminococcus sp.]|nr:hypothetical protein [Acidaminococcus sp.]